MYAVPPGGAGIGQVLAVPHHPAQPHYLVGRDVAGGDQVRPQEVGQHPGVYPAGLDPRVRYGLCPERVGQDDGISGVPHGQVGPVPDAGGFDHNLGIVRQGPEELPDGLLVVLHPGVAEEPASIIHDGGLQEVLVQIHPDVYLAGGMNNVRSGKVLGVPRGALFNPHIRLQQTPGRTPDSEVNNLHYELGKLTVDRLARLATIISAGMPKRMPEKRIKALLHEAVSTGQLNKADAMPPEMKG